jgi:hypothetical protein
MNSYFSRISENVLFSLLIAAVVGWTVVSMATEAASPAASAGSCVAGTAAGISNS